ncbi:hypothetical protein SPRG_07053 [Saprolegnia parasitica CBS 223.65]|uniref:DNA polymerase n=1 Tax=Saprolegnia parasitica (strain CBS 223.65) TaxID=695850 RepID=A0A067C9L0_SAPPC|nr:hypothetical protein SPRG_07053 [Saprolegnia parasitica CBS 223.65]KDO27464.1 hypothetical protein SPRG_07053 [Saprolegnia parasitica CBS 223.65]|eukprot:XP_012201902.1 hypothetical protein SPRG_07053 [Saprolegnia parasitica CBS 223.65]
MLSAKRKARFFDKLNEIYLPTKRPANEIDAPSVVSSSTGDASDRRQSFPPMAVTKALVDKARRRQSMPLAGPLQGLRLLIVPLGSDMSRRRLDIWTTQVAKAGGQLVTTCDDSDTIVVASLSLSRERLCSYCHVSEMPPSLRVVSPDWLVHVIQHRTLPPDGMFPWRNGGDVAPPVAADDAPPQKAFYESSPGNTQESPAPPPTPRSAIVVASPLRALDEDMAYRKRIFYENNPSMVDIHAEEAADPRQIKASSFVCATTSVQSINHNSHLTSVLDELIEYLAVEKDEWRENSYKRMLSILKQLPAKVTSTAALRPQYGFNATGIAKIREILETGTLRKLQAKKADARLQVLRTFANIWGVGPATATSLYSQGFRSLDALRARQDEVLNPQQRIGLHHYADFLVKIPRAEVEEIQAIVKATVATIHPTAVCVTCGSYRRGKLQSGDVDILITDPLADECVLLPDLLRELHKRTFLTDDLTTVTEHHTGGCDSYMGVCRVDERRPFRRIDLKVYPRRLFGFAQLYFTGSDHFNRSMRAYAKQKGYSLTDRGLTKVARAKGAKKLKQAPGLICPDEKDVFIALQLPYKV